MNFTLKIKQELINKKMNKEEILSFVNGMLCTHILNPQDHDVKLRILNIEIFNFLLDCLEKLKWQYLVNKNTIFIPYKYFQRIKPKYANVYLAGIFLSSGSISNLNSSSYHLEISFKNPELWIEIMEFAKKNIQFNKIQNKKNFVLYLKKNDRRATWNECGSWSQKFGYSNNCYLRYKRKPRNGWLSCAG